MAEIDLTTLSENDVVLHFGGRPNEVDAFTFSNSLLAFSEAIREINSQINPVFSLRIAIEGTGPGSFRAQIKTRVKTIGGLFHPDAKSLLLGVLGNALYGALAPSSPPHHVMTINSNEVILQVGDDTIKMSRSVWDASEKLPNPSAVKRHVAQGFSALARDPSVTEFGLSKGMRDNHPVGIIDRKHFERLSQHHETGKVPGTRYRDTEHAKLAVLRVVFEKSTRRWQFVWNGNRISASIFDQDFFDRVMAGESFSKGDVLDADIRVHQELETGGSGIYINSGYEILKVHSRSHRERQGDLLDK